MLTSVDAALARLYPTRTWGEPDDALADGMTPSDIGHLADELANELKAATFVRMGGDDEPCDYIYVLCLGRTPCIVQVRDYGVPAPDEWIASRTPKFALAAGGRAVGSDAPPDTRDDTAISELYLRIVVSQRAHVAAVQQVAFDVLPASSVAPDRRSPAIGNTDAATVETSRSIEHPARDCAWVVHERPRAGVYDAPLLARMQKLVAILPAYGLLHVDFGEIAHAPPGFGAGAWSSLFQGQPAIANYLFYPHPTTMTSTVIVEPHR